MILANVPSNSKLARSRVEVFLILKNKDSSSALLLMMHNTTLASLKRISNLLLSGKSLLLLVPVWSYNTNRDNM